MVSIVEPSDAHVRVTMPVMPGILKPFGTILAGAMIWFADVAATRLAIGERRGSAPTAKAS